MDEENKSSKTNRKQNMAVCHNHCYPFMLAMEQLLRYSMNLKNVLNNGTVSAGSCSAILCHQYRIIQKINKADDKSNFLDTKRNIA